MGIVHEVPIDELAAFLTMEGVVKNRRLKPEEGEDRRRYDIIKVDVLCNTYTFQVLTLEGRCRSSIESKPRTDYDCRKKLEDYVEIARKGAKDFGIDTLPFDEDSNHIRRHFS